MSKLQSEERRQWAEYQGVGMRNLIILLIISTTTGCLPKIEHRPAPEASPQVTPQVEHIDYEAIKERGVYLVRAHKSISNQIRINETALDRITEQLDALQGRIRHESKATRSGISTEPNGDVTSVGHTGRVKRMGQSGVKLRIEEKKKEADTIRKRLDELRDKRQDVGLEVERLQRAYKRRIK